MLRQSLAWTALGLFALSGPLGAQTLTPLAHQTLAGTQVEMQLTDGTVLVQAESFDTMFGSQWYRLTPDIHGSYVNGTWSVVGLMTPGHSPFGANEAVLADGRVVVVGGEYNFLAFDLTNKCSIFDPKTGRWFKLDPPKTWNYIGDSPLVVLSDGKLLVGDKLNKRMAELDPATLTWTKLEDTGKSDFNAEEGWTLMPDGTVFTADIKHAPNTELYTPATQTWRSLGATPVKLTSPGSAPEDYGGKKPYHPPGEIGPAMLMPDGSVFQAGALAKGETAAHTAIFADGAWTAGPDFPDGDEAADTWESLLPNGHALVEGVSGALYEFDGTNLTAEPFNVGFSPLMVLPTGEVLVGGYAVYASSGTSDPAWAPKITSYPATIARGATYQIFGKQFNGLSQANAFGDELTTATNYPLVRITNNRTGHVFYARTHDHSTMGVATGDATVWTYFDVPPKLERGIASLAVVANGIPSAPVRIRVD